MRLSRCVGASGGALAVLALASGALADDNTLRLTQTLQLADSSATQTQRSQQQGPNVSEPQRFAVSIGGLYTHRETETSAWAPSFQVNYAATDRLELHFMAPMVIDHLAGHATHYGIGDIEIGARYRFIDENVQGWEPAVAFYPLIDLPTGSLHDNLGTGSTHAFLPLWLSKSFGAWTPYGGGGYWINPGANNRNWGFALVGLQRHVSDAFTLGAEVFHATSIKVGLKDQTGFDVNGRYNLTDTHHVVFSLGSGIQNAATTNEVTAYVAYLLTF